jgi:acyl-CoA-binding protein
MRSHAVSTRDMRSVAGGIVVSSGFGVVVHRRWWLTSTASTDIFTDGRHAMADLEKRFEKAVADSKKLPEKPDNATLLQIYSLYKQATEGDVEGKRPGFTDMVGRAKWDAWNGQKGKDASTAMQEYIDLIESLK